jgi:Thioesterase superfamily
MTAPARHFFDVPAELPPGAAAEKRKLAAALRELMALCVTTDPTDASVATLTDTTAAVRALSAKLGQHSQRTFKQAYTPDPVAMIAFADRNSLVGLANPLSPPLVMRREGDRSIGECTFGPPYEGAPGFVHGGLVAAAFDAVFGHLQVTRGVASFTGSLTIHYRLPTPMGTPLRFTAHVERESGKQSFLKGRVLSGDRVTAEAEAIFISVDPERMRAMFSGTEPKKD